MKAQRQAAILELVDREPIASQFVLQRRLRGIGFHATQATLSRDIKELGLAKRSADGAYQRAAPLPGAESGVVALERVVAQFLTRADQVQQFVVLRTGPGQAQPLAAAVDRAALPEIVGTIAGDDTILVIVRDRRRAAAFVKRLEKLMG
jgi:transcriptional regulator of arginine metabolism